MQESEKDIISEFAYGEGAIKVISKSMVIAVSNVGQFERTAVLSIVIGNLLSEYKKGEYEKESYNPEKEFEMWEGEIILIPCRKYMDCNEERLTGLRFDQILTTSWQDPRNWDRKIFDKKEKICNQFKNKKKKK